MAVRLDLKVAIIQSGRTQRALAAVSNIPEIKLSNIIRGVSRPNSTERAALAAALGRDYFDDSAADRARAARVRSR